MCGIAGIITRDSISTAKLQRMTRALAHRGPDGEGFLIAGRSDEFFATDVWAQRKVRGNVNVGFGHRRLAIVDTSSAGHQPMRYGDRYWITYNGEIYNYVELRIELQRAGYLFHSGSDTEVIMAAYDHWGAECLQRFNGMWAFAMLDLKDDVLFLSRDRMGVKPLYLCAANKSFMFASEIKAFSAVVEKISPNESLVRSFLGAN